MMKTKTWPENNVSKTLISTSQTGLGKTSRNENNQTIYETDFCAQYR